VAGEPLRAQNAELLTDVAGEVTEWSGLLILPALFVLAGRCYNALVERFAFRIWQCGSDSHRTVVAPPTSGNLYPSQTS